jgi:hypothetical protein
MDMLAAPSKEKAKKGVDVDKTVICGYLNNAEDFVML